MVRVRKIMHQTNIPIFSFRKLAVYILFFFWFFSIFSMKLNRPDEIIILTAQKTTSCTLTEK